MCRVIYVIIATLQNKSCNMISFSDISDKLKLPVWIWFWNWAITCRFPEKVVSNGSKLTSIERTHMLFDIYSVIFKKFVLQNNKKIILNIRAKIEIFNCF